MRAARAWLYTALEVEVAINVSLRQFRDATFVDRIRLNCHGVPPAQLNAEITESTAMRDADCVEPGLEALHSLGAAVAIDGFRRGPPVARPAAGDDRGRARARRHVPPPPRGR